jgi:hypothetical protein
MKNALRLMAVCLGLLMGGVVLAQGTNATLSGTVTDATEGAVPDALITVENINTGVVTTTTTNAAGIYIFPSLQPGVYRITGEKTGFRKLIYNEVTLEISARITVNLQLEVGTVTEAAVEVNAALDTRLALGTSSVGGVLSGHKVQELPLPSRNALGLVLTQAGLVGDNFSGARIGTLNVTRDGINVMDQRINSGVNSVSFTSVDIVDEVRVITSPADAEFGRGSGQVQITTKSGTNEFHGSVFEAHRNTALNANSWFNNLQGLDRSFLIRNQFGGRVGGPIIKNKTFFHVNFEGQRQSSKANVTSTVYTQTARQGIYRFFPGVQNSNANGATPTVDLAGNPVKPAAATGDLQSVNLFGRDPNRLMADPTGRVQSQIALMPLPNSFRSGDGLNTAGFIWRRAATDDFNSLTLRFDHHLNQEHQFKFSFTRETGEDLNGFLAQPFPDSPGGKVVERTHFYSLGVTSTLSPRLVNEFRVGAQRSTLRFLAPWETEEGKAALPQIGGQGAALVTILATDPINYGNDPQGRISPLYQFSDTLTWLKGRHSFKGGVELRFGSTNGFNSFNVLPRVNIGAGGAAVTGINTIPGIGANQAGAQNLLLDLAGSVSTVVQAFNSPGGVNPVFLAGEGKQRTWQQREFSVFFKDDFRVSPNLTLNLGVRYEWYGVPFEANGKTAGLIGGSPAIFGLSGTSFADLYQPGRLNGSLTQLQLVGKNSPNEKTKLYNDDWNNFAPAIGLSWAIPYFGRNKTTLRAGYSIGYEKNSLRIVDVVAGDQPGLRTVTTFSSASALNLGTVSLPLSPAGQPLALVPLTDRNQTVRVFDSNLRAPYVQNWNLSIQREMFKGIALEVRYVGNKGTKLVRGANINEVNIFETGILNAFRITQAGGNAPLFDQIFLGLNLGLGAVNGTTVTGSASLRNNANTRGFFAQGDVGGFANFLNTTTNFTGIRGELLRRAGLPENFIVGNPQFAAANLTSNFANSTYHSLQIEGTKRLSHGLQFQSNYTFSKALGEEEGAGQEMLDSFRNGRDRSQDKRLLTFHITHVLRNSGTWELPFGPGRKFLSGSNGFISRLVERWQVGTIFNVFSGSPINVSAARSTFNQFTDNTPNLVGPLPKSAGKVQKIDNGVIYFTGFQSVVDPAVANLTTAQGLQGRSTLRAIADASGNIILVNPTPGALGTLAPLYLQGPGSFRLDINLVKRVQIRENINFEFRGDFIDAFNTPQFNNPTTDINSLNFGRITGAGGARLIVLSARVNF